MTRIHNMIEKTIIHSVIGTRYCVKGYIIDIKISINKNAIIKAGIKANNAIKFEYFEHFMIKYPNIVQYITPVTHVNKAVM